MRILWITNIVFPKLSKAIGLESPVFGGWTYSLANLICKFKEVELHIVNFADIQSYTRFEIDDVCYHLLPRSRESDITSSQDSIWKKILKDVKPDCIHVHGTEYNRALVCIRASGGIPYVVSIQGMIGPYARYVEAGISLTSVLRNLTLRDSIKFNLPFVLRRKWIRESRFENEYIKRAAVVLGRTDWDFAHTMAIFPNANYRVGNEVLRREFYTAPKWNIKDCRRHSIFVSQGSSPIKGLHKLIEALAYLKQDYPDLTLFVSGNPIKLNIRSFRGFLRNSWYRLYIRSLIQLYDLSDRITFIGLSDSSRMVHEYQSAHVSISCSSIENSSNSIGEAQLIGTPVIASYVGGTPDMLNHGKAGLLYRFENVPMLVWRIRQIFESDELASNLSTEGIRLAEIRHDRQSIVDHLINIYREVI